MNFQTKQHLFDNFLNEWGTQFRKIPFILNYIDSYPELKSYFSELLPLISDDLNDSQMEWVSLVSQLDNPDDTVFFKPYWVPIQKLEYDAYIDLSSESFPVFQLGYFPFEPYRWYKKYLFKSIFDLLRSINDPSIFILKHIEKNKYEANQLLKEYFKERDRLGFSGELKPEPVEKYHLEIENKLLNFSHGFIDESVGNENVYDDEKEVIYEDNSFEFIDNKTVIIKGVKPYAIGLLPYEGKISLVEIDYDEHKLVKYKDQVKCFNAFLYLLSSKRMVNSFKIIFNEVPFSYAEYSNHKLLIYFYNSEILETMKNKFQELIQD